MQIGKTNAIPIQGTITIIIDDESDIEPEGYILCITPDNITINARTTAGAFWAFATLRQLMPIPTQRAVPIAQCIDQSSLCYHKRCSAFCLSWIAFRCFSPLFSNRFYKKNYIDLMAFYKLNTFHWHLTDDQGWRIEIKKYPKLQEIALIEIKPL